MNWAPTILLSITALSFAAPNLAQAHGHHHDHHEHHDAQSQLGQAVRDLEEHLDRRVAAATRFGVHSEAEESETGKLLLSTVESELAAHMATHEKPGIAKRGRRALAHIVQRFNPIQLGRWILHTAREHGPAIGVVYGITETAETIATLMAFKYPQLAFLLPISAAHVSDVVVIGLGVSAPKLFSTLRTWKRQGGGGLLGLARGPWHHYVHLLSQRALLPVDWNVVLDQLEHRDKRFVVIRENALERRLPRRLRIIFSPRKLAQRESAPTFAIWELERIARENDVETKHIKRHVRQPRAYLRALLGMISASPGASRSFSEMLDHRVQARSDAWALSIPLDAERIVAARSAEDLERLGREVSETPDVLAARLVWYFRGVRERLYEEAGRQTTGIPPAQRKVFRKLRALLDGDRGLARIASTPHAQVEAKDWRELFAEIHLVNEKLQEIEITLPLSARRCASLLTNN